MTSVTVISYSLLVFISVIPATFMSQSVFFLLQHLFVSFINFVWFPLARFIWPNTESESNMRVVLEALARFTRLAIGISTDHRFT